VLPSLRLRCRECSHKDKRQSLSPAFIVTSVTCHTAGTKQIKLMESVGCLKGSAERTVVKEQSASGRCFRKKRSNPLVCGVDGVPLIHQQSSGNLDTSGFGDFTFLVCPVSGEVAMTN
jgi:hypothetical protein